jgi:hypothetical protein
MHGSEVAHLARTILRTAWGAPIVAQARGRRIIGGHGRLEAAKLILAGLEVDGELRGGAEHSFGGPPGCVPVRLLDVSDAEADAMTLADNARGLQGTDNAEAIIAMAAGFGRESALMADMGYDAAALDAMVKSAGDAVLKTAPTEGVPAGDYDEEWQGMPEHVSQDVSAKRSINVLLDTEEDERAFLKLTGGRLYGGYPKGTRTMPWPNREQDRIHGTFLGHEYVDE